MPEHADRVRALELVRRMAAAQDMFVVGAEEGPTFFMRLGSILGVLERAGLAIVRREADERPAGATLTDSGMDAGCRLLAGHVALFPAGGGIKLVANPISLEDAQVPQRGSGVPVWVRAVAPSHYGPDVVEGSATVVIADPIERWESHPALRWCRRDDCPVQCAWEIFTRSGRSLGLILGTAGGFDGVDAFGGYHTEHEFAAVAWQIAVNC
ncbi:hypothetical protein ASF57_18275 [Methylobacterium sp. Leaf117]|nr:hypothetical protein ASF57_18275 [Methylobacterium sp. Leaf117]